MNKGEKYRTKKLVWRGVIGLLVTLFVVILVSVYDQVTHARKSIPIQPVVHTIRI